MNKCVSEAVHPSIGVRFAIAGFFCKLWTTYLTVDGLVTPSYWLVCRLPTSMTSSADSYYLSVKYVQTDDNKAHHLATIRLQPKEWWECMGKWQWNKKLFPNSELLWEDPNRLGSSIKEAITSVATLVTRCRRCLLQDFSMSTII